MKRIFFLSAIFLACGGCRLAMHDQPKHEPLESSSFFKDGSSARPLLPGTIARGYLRTNSAYFEALRGTNLVDELPIKPTRELLQRGRERFEIYCSVCHGLSGEGDGMIVRRGFPQPPSFHTDRLRQVPLGHIYRVITYGYGVMYPYAVRVEPKDRWGHRRIYSCAPTEPHRDCREPASVRGFRTEGGKAMSHALQDHLRRLQTRCLSAGAIALILASAGAFFSAKQFFVSYLFGYLFWLGLAVGSLLVVMIHHLTGGRWGHVTRRFSEAAFCTLPVMAILFIPILFGLRDLYPWARTEQLSELLMKKRAYLNPVFFIVRVVLYFTIWLLFAWRLRKWSVAQDSSESSFPARRLSRLSGIGLVAVPLTATFAYFDWIMSTEAEWYSTIFAVIVLSGQVLAAYAFNVVLLREFEREEPFASLVTPAHYHQLGNLLLTFVMFWTYVAFGQLLIIYSANLPDEISWYLHRIAGGWKYILIAIALFHFFLPFMVLLFRAAKKRGRFLARIALLLLIIHFVYDCWMIAPGAFPNGIELNWLNLAAPAGIGGIWIAAFLWFLGRAPLIPVNDPRMQAEMAQNEDWEAPLNSGEKLSGLRTVTSNES